MIKSSELVVVVDSVEEAIKFYTEKLAFDIVALEVSKENAGLLAWAQMRKGKCLVIFRTPLVEELAEFSFIKRCASRCVGLYVEIKKGLDKYFERCQKKNVKILADIKDSPSGQKSFTIRDPFGIKITCAQAKEKHAPVGNDFLGLRIDAIKQTNENLAITSMVDHLKTFGILRRAGKKFAKQTFKKIRSSQGK